MMKEEEEEEGWENWDYFSSHLTRNTLDVLSTLLPIALSRSKLEGAGRKDRLSHTPHAKFTCLAANAPIDGPDNSERRFVFLSVANAKRSRRSNCRVANFKAFIFSTPIYSFAFYL